MPAEFVEFPIIFIHLLNGDGTSDSICTNCFRVTGTDFDRQRLAALEKLHLCDPSMLNVMREHQAQLRGAQLASKGNDNE